MFDGRFHLNSSPLGTILNLLCTISFSDSVDKHDDELDGEKDQEGDLFLFLASTLTSFISFCWSILLSLALMKENLFSFSLSCVIYIAFLLRKSLGVLIPSLLADHMSYLHFIIFLPCLITGVNYRGNNIRIMLICMQRLSIFQTFWHYLIY